MATTALDMATVLVGLNTLVTELKSSPWSPQVPNLFQEELLSLLGQYGPELSGLSGLEAKTSRFWQELNNFLSARNFDPMVTEFDPELGLGVVTILDKLVEWAHGPGELVTIPTKQGGKPGFELPAQGVKVYQVQGYRDAQLIEVATKNQDTLWLFLPGLYSDVPMNSAWSSFTLAQRVMSASRQVSTRSAFHSASPVPVYGKVQIPMLDFDVKPDLSWLLGMSVDSPSSTYTISQAKQQFKFRMNQHGARAKVATVIAVMRGGSMEPLTLVVDQPFFGWFTQAGVQLPLATFFADWDSWKQPAGDLSSL